MLFYPPTISGWTRLCWTLVDELELRAYVKAVRFPCICGLGLDKLPFNTYDFFAYISCGGIVAATVDYAFGNRIALDTQERSVLTYALIILVCYVTGHFVAQVSSFLLEQLFVRRLLGSPFSILMAQHRPAVAWRRLFPNYCDPLPEATQDKVRKNAAHFAVSAESTGFFFHVYEVVSQNSRHSDRLDAFRD